MMSPPTEPIVPEILTPPLRVSLFSPISGSRGYWWGASPAPSLPIIILTSELRIGGTGSTVRGKHRGSHRADGERVPPHDSGSAEVVTHVRPVPALPGAERLTHDEVLFLIAEPRQLLGEPAAAIAGSRRTDGVGHSAGIPALRRPA